MRKKEGDQGLRDSDRRRQGGGKKTRLKKVTLPAAEKERRSNDP